MELIPEPRSMRIEEGALDLSGGGEVHGDARFGTAAALTATWMNEAFALREDAARFSSRSTQTQPTQRAAGAAVELAYDPSLGLEDYRLEIKPAGARIIAGYRDGAVRGASTLRQALLSEGPVLPCLSIEDGPRFTWRGAMLDCARNFFRVEFVERFIDLMALHKLNRFHWHLTDDQAWRLEIASHPEICELGSKRQDRRYGQTSLKTGSYTRADAERVVAYAAERGIAVVPEIETPGHALALLASHPELSCAAASGDPAFLPEDRYGIFEDVLCAGNDAVFALLGDVFDEVASIFPCPWVHAGGDEVLKERWSACPRCLSRMETEGLRAGGKPDPELLQAWFMNKVAQMLAERGKRMVGWDEILSPDLREDSIIMSWRGVEGGIAAAKAGRDSIMCSQRRACYLDHKNFDSPDEPGNLGVCTVADSYSYDPVPPGMPEDAAARILGGQANLWSEFMYFGRHVEYMAFPRLCALAEVFWTPREKRNFASFEKRLAVHGARLDLLGVSRYRGPAR